MECKYCQKHNPENIIYETTHWYVILANDQYYLGRCIVILKRHCENLTNLEKSEWDEFMDIVKKLEVSLKKSFNVTMFNWTCLMNHAYKDKNPNPHIHWDLKPRYNHSVKIDHLVFEDLEFGEHYDLTKKQEVSPEIIKKIIFKIKDNL